METILLPCSRFIRLCVLINRVSFANDLNLQVCVAKVWKIMTQLHWTIGQMSRTA